MARSCCVQGCNSGKRVPSYGIPTNKERRKRWLQILKLNITDEDVIKWLRVCHKHFHENDYSCSPRYRRLINTAVPCMELVCPEEAGTQLQQEEVFQQQTEMTIPQKREEIQERMEVLHQQQERMEVLSQKREEIQERMEMLHHEQEERMEMLSKEQDKIQERMEMLHHEQEERMEMVSQEQDKIQERMEMLHHEQEKRMEMVSQEQEIQEKMDMLYHEREKRMEMSQKQEEIQERMEMLHYQQQEKIEVLSQKQEKIEKQLNKDNKHTLSARRRPNLLKITRQSTLNSQARLFYQKVIKLQKDQRRLKQIIRKMKQKRTSNRITLSTTDHRGRKDKTSLIRQQILDLIIKHDKVAPQGRRYTLEEKMFCLSLFKRSRTSYNFLSTYLHLPSHVTLKKQLRNIPIDTGCNKSVLQYLCLIKEEID
ncbi:uncharacterized protein [Temnothorax nylanderi]|uniref:uncharacterized protein isoform X1 n=1 Tax=Temnothorax nylanderi TaxID=102681 RepID=UPI003A861090